MVVVASFLFSASAVLAANNSWTGPSGGSWETPANWSLGVAPTNTDSMYITNSGTYVVNVDNTTADSGSSSTWLTVSNLTVGSSSGMPTLSICFTNTARTFTVNQSAIVGPSSSGSGSLIVSNGTFASRLLTVGTASGSEGILNLYSGAVRVTEVGSGNALVLGSSSGSTGTVFVGGGTLASSNSSVKTIIGDSGFGRMTISNSTVYTKTLIEGYSAAGSGLISILAGGTLVADGAGGQWFHLGSAGSGTVVVDGGLLRTTNLITFEISRGANNAASGTLIVSNGFTELSGATTVIGGSDYGGTGSWRIYGGTNTVTSSTFFVANNGSGSPSKGNILLAGGLLDASTVEMRIGSAGIGTVSVSNGVLRARTVSLAGGARAQGQWTVAGGTSVISSNVAVAIAVNSTGTVLVTGGNLFVTNAASTAAIEIGTLGVGSMTMSNGIVTSDRLVATNGANSAFNFVGGTLNLRATMVSNNANFVVGNGISTASLNLQGGTHSFANGLTLNTNATLGGAGFSTLTLGGNLTLASNSTFVVDLMTNTVTGIDRTFVTGTVSLAESILSLRITNYNATIGTQFTIIDNDGTSDPVTGYFHGLTNNAFIDVSANGQDGFFRILYNGGDGNDVVLLATIPEPSVLALLAGATLLVCRRRGV